jgi:hypothetical protein
MAKTDDEFLELINKLRKDKKAYKKAQLGAEKIAERFDSSAGAERLAIFCVAGFLAFSFDMNYIIAGLVF